MSSPEDLLAPDEKLIVGGRYQILPEGKVRKKAHTRVTNFAKTLDDTYNLTNWMRRMDALGFSDRPDLVALVASHKDDKSALDNICEQAKAAAGGNDQRDAGTYLHAATEAADRGEPVPAQWAREVEVYHLALERAGITILPEYIEGLVVVPEYGLAGRFDRLVLLNGEIYVADLKTGSVGHNWLTFAIQFACYANAKTLYDPATETHTPMPAVNKEKALVFHLPPSEGTCTVYAVDIKVGWEAAKVVEEVRRLRREGRKLGTEVASAALPDSTSVIEAEPDNLEQPEPLVKVAEPDEIQKVADGSLRKWVEDKVRWLVEQGYVNDLQARWPKGVAGLKASQDHTEAELDLIRIVVEQVESKAGKPFGELDPRTPPERRVKLVADKLVAEGATYVIDEGDEIAFPEFDAIQQAFAKLDAKQQLTLGKIAGEAHAAGYPLNLRSKPCRRRADITQALIALADHDEDVIRAVAYCGMTLTDSEPPLGVVIGGMTLDEAHQFLTNARKLNEGMLIVTFGAHGPEVEPADDDVAA